MTTAGPSTFKHVLAAVLLVAYGTAAAWLVRSEGHAYRLAHRPDPVAPEVAVSIDEETVPQARPRPALKKRPPRPEPATKIARRPGPNPAVRETADPLPTPEPARPDPAPAPVPDPFWTEESQQKHWDPDHLSLEDERTLGAALNRMVLKMQKPVTQGPMPRRLEEAAEIFVAAVTRKGINYTLTVLDGDVPNAFSHPGGYIYVSRALLESIPSEETYALEFIVGHEIAHVDLHHAVECLRDPEVKKLKAATVPLFYALLIPFGYRPDQELAADRWSRDVMARAGRSKRQTLNFLRGLEVIAQDHGFENQPLKPQDDPRVDPLDNHLRGHRVIPRNRLKALLGPG